MQISVKNFSSLRIITRIEVGVLLLVGLLAFFFSGIFPPPSLESLVPAEGPLLSYSLYTVKSSDSEVDALFRLGGYSGRFWNEALKNQQINRLEGRVGSTIRVMYLPHSRSVPKDGDAVRSFGLSVDGQEITSAADEVKADRAINFWGFPAIGIAFLGMGYVVYIKGLKKRWEIPPDNEITR